MFVGGNYLRMSLAALVILLDMSSDCRFCGIYGRLKTLLSLYALAWYEHR